MSLLDGEWDTRITTFQCFVEHDTALCAQLSIMGPPKFQVLPGLQEGHCLKGQWLACNSYSTCCPLYCKLISHYNGSQTPFFSLPRGCNVRKENHIASKESKHVSNFDEPYALLCNVGLRPTTQMSAHPRFRTPNVVSS